MKMHPSRSILQRLSQPRFYGLHPDYEALEPFVCTLPERFEAGEGEIIYQGRNTLRRMEYNGLQLVVKSFAHPSIVNRVVYGTLRGSKAKRSFLYAKAFQSIGVGTPQPVAWLDQRNGLLLDKSYYVSLLSTCTLCYDAVFARNFPYTENLCRTLGKQSALLHNNGYLHKDYGRGNILYEPLHDNQVKIEIVDLNRMYRGPVNLKMGCKNFERLPATPEMHHWMAEEYAKIRGFDMDECYNLITHYRCQAKGNENI